MEKNKRSFAPGSISIHGRSGDVNSPRFGVEVRVATLPAFYGFDQEMLSGLAALCVQHKNKTLSDGVILQNTTTQYLYGPRL